MATSPATTCCGSLTFALADFEIVAPNVGGFIVSIADQGALEFSIIFARS